ncbi:MAG: YciI family protein [Pseudomonadota bacterium]|nr:YciI family protein [Pseudomonadota bacterium]
MSDDTETVETLMARMMAKSFYLIENRLTADPSEIGPVLKDHLLYMIDLEKTGQLFLSGPLFDRDDKMTFDGMTIIRAGSFDEAEAIAARDPFVVAGLRKPVVHRWVVNEGRLSVSVDLSDRSATLD